MALKPLHERVRAVQEKMIKEKMMRLKRHPANPLLLPKPHHAWEAMNVFNCAVVYHNDLFHMLYRAQGLDYVSHIGYALSEDGIHWKRLDEPVLSPEGDYDRRGVEDPRITKIGDWFYMLYTAYGTEKPGGSLETPVNIRVAMARSKNLITWERLGIVLPEQDDKDAALFPEKVGGRYLMFHRLPRRVWLAYSDDLKDWSDTRMIMEPRPGNWDGVSIGANGPPIKTEAGWLFIYHGYAEDRVYRTSAVLLDLNDPARVLSRPSGFILQPEETWELKGDVPNVVFSCSALPVGDQLYVYYAGADRVIGLATCSIAEIMDFLNASRE